MITDKTVFILGAGASAPYGYPTGLGLRKWLRESLPQTANNEFRIQQRLKEPERKALLDDLRKFIDEYGNTDQGVFIDLFLSRRQEFLDIGKWAIIAAIFYHELNSQYGDDIKSPDYDWMSILFRNMNSDIKDNSYNRISENNISFISFNYDRSLEYCLHRSICRNFGASEEDAAQIIGDIPIIHMYGRISPMSWEDSSGIKFRPALDKVDPSILSKNIQVMYSDRTTKATKKAMGLIEDAKFLYFLGFGYAEDNLNAIGIPQRLNQDHIIKGTGYKISNRILGRANRVIRGDKIPSNNVNLEPTIDSAELLRKNLEIFG